MNILLLASLAIGLAYITLNFRYSIQMLQQNSYRLPRFWHWLERGHLMTTWSLVDVLLLFALYTTLVPYQFAVLLCGLVWLAKIVLILRRKSIKPLVFTKRVWRIYGVTLALAYALIAGLGWIDIAQGKIALSMEALVAIFGWSIVMLTVVVLMPVEAIINRRYYNDARRILRGMPDLKVVGITGSYGKTSTKHYLWRILSEQYEVLMTPGSYNTTMGVIRTIREHLKPYDQIFICEMGAKQKGDIKEICDLVHPGIGIITAVGPMHLETFKTLENVQTTKFELVDSLPADGLAVINNDFEPCRDRDVRNVAAERYAVAHTDGADYYATDIQYAPDGTSFVVEGPDGFRLPLRTRLVGECNISNLLGAVIVALHLGVKPQAIARGVSAIDQVEHRLSIRRGAGGITVIDDAFNSNPVGSRMAVDVLAAMKGGKRILVTPGMVELGAQQERLNREFATYAADKADIIILVGHHNRQALRDGLDDAGATPEKIKEAESFAHAQQILSGILAPGDTVLYENDLPDSFK